MDGGRGGAVVGTGVELLVWISMLRNAFLFFALLSSVSAYATVSPESAKLEALRLQVENSHSPVLEQKYLDLFPSNYRRFSQTFYGKDLNTLDELYDQHYEHLSLLQSLSEKYPNKVLSIWLGVATNGHWEADAVGILQHQLAKYAASHTQEFASALIAKTPKERISIIQFLADVENHYYYSDYTSIIENLKSLGYVELRTQFAKAKQDRMKHDDH
jgi:hypothetical protein